MRNQKQSNKSPRPFKNNNSGPDWSGGSGSTGFIPVSKKPTLPVKKAASGTASNANAPSSEAPSAEQG